MNQLEKFKEIRTFIFDVDGVLTNNEVLVTEDGQLLRTMNVRDGYAIKHAIESGYRVCIITGGRSEGVRKRLEMLGVEDIYVNRQEKLEAYEEYIQAYELDEGEILYMGDDLPDYPVMRRVGFPVCPNDAAYELLEIAQYVSPFAGGMGCARDVIQKVMLLHGTWRE
jgi:3-deoxy-D-manno-octulosonate 8-phosphate phosphatase (KDO 8-P phosphatase)